MDGKRDVLKVVWMEKFMDERVENWMNEWIKRGKN